MQVSVTAVRGFCASLLFIVGSGIVPNCFQGTVNLALQAHAFAVLLLIISLFLEWVQIDGRAAWAYPEAGVSQCCMVIAWHDFSIYNQFLV
jgi:hypothetical protein